MRADREDESLRRSLVPPRAAGSLWFSAAWTGAGTAVVAAIASVAMVAVLWLPTAGAAGNADSAIRAGLLTFLAGLHGGITVDGLSADFVPLGLTLLVAALAWRAGAGLADAADDLDAREPGRLIAALVAQVVAFAVTCLALGRLATLGTSSVPVFGSTVAALLLFGVVSGAAMLRWSPLRDDLDAVLGPAPRAALRAGAAVVTVYLLGGTLLAAGALAVHHGRVEALSAQVGGGFSGVPILVLGALAAPNAVLAGASYLAGPGFAVGSGNGVSLWSGAHGTLPAFPILGALPSAPAGAAAWVLAALTLVVAGGCAAVAVRGEASTLAEQCAGLARAAAVAGALMLVLAWQGGGAIGSGQLSAVGASPWQCALALAAVTLVAGGVGLAVIAALDWARRHRPAADPLRALAERANAAAERLEATHSVVEKPSTHGVLHSTLRSVAAAVSVTEDERRQQSDDETGKRAG